MQYNTAKDNTIQYNTLESIMILCSTKENSTEYLPTNEKGILQINSDWAIPRINLFTPSGLGQYSEEGDTVCFVINNVCCMTQLLIHSEI